MFNILIGFPGNVWFDFENESFSYFGLVRGFCAVSLRQWHPTPKSAVSAAILMFLMFLIEDSSWSRKDSFRKSKWQQISCAPKTESITDSSAVQLFSKDKNRQAQGEH